MAPVIRPAPFPAGTVFRGFVRGRARPRGVAWFGVRSFWGHLRHFVASAIATEDVDSRDWMTPDPPQALVERVARLLGAHEAGATVTERLGRDLWIDYIADTGDDSAVSRAVAGLVFAEYEVPDPERPGEFLRTPRGDVLFFGGDTAYPVATADEIRDRVIAPFNQVLSEREDGKRRVLLGIPGNHDWYDGLDGFGRMFRRHVDYHPDGTARPTLHASSRTLLGQYAEFAREFVLGGQIDKPKTLNLIGYTAVQAASYFVLPVAPHIPMIAVDRQLKNIDSRQQFFFVSWLNEHIAVSPWVLLPDPVFRFGEPSPTGTESLRSLHLTLGSRPHLVVSGDIHHYCREVEGPSLHITAGGGGAFLHPAPIARKGLRPMLVEWPDARQSRSLLWQVPWKVAVGRSGFLPHMAFLLMFAPLVLASEGPRMGDRAAFETMAVLATILALIGGVRRHRATLFLAVPVAAGMSFAPVGARLWLNFVLSRFIGARVELWVASVLELFVAMMVGAYLFGLYLALLTLLGLENTQAFTALDHPGFKHFVRFRVRADGSRVDGFCVGLVDPARAEEQPVLVDAFTWKSR